MSDAFLSLGILDPFQELLLFHFSSSPSPSPGLCACLTWPILASTCPAKLNRRFPPLVPPLVTLHPQSTAQQTLRLPSGAARSLGRTAYNPRSHVIALLSSSLGKPRSTPSRTSPTARLPALSWARSITYANPNKARMQTTPIAISSPSRPFTYTQI
eukprot:1745912-Pleurochrysis_carterae.AAC.1